MTTADNDEPPETTLWEWVPFGNDEAVKRPASVIGWSLFGLIFLAIGIYQIQTALSPDCVGRICRFGEFKGAVSVLLGLTGLAFPWLSTKFRGFWARHYTLTASSLTRAVLGRKTRINLSAGNFRVQYGMVWLEPDYGRKKRLTSIMSHAKAVRFFAALRKARSLGAAS